MKRSPIKPKRARRMSKPGGTITFEMREAILARDLGCRAHRMGFATDVPCDGPLQVHHRIIDKLNNTDENLMTICDHHHHLAHRVRRAEAEACAVIIRRGSATLPQGETP